MLILLLLGQGVFLVYLFGSYGRTALVGDLAAWARFSATGGVSSDTIGNRAMAVHVAITSVVLIGGALQLRAHMVSPSLATSRRLDNASGISCRVCQRRSSLVSLALGPMRHGACATMRCTW